MGPVKLGAALAASALIVACGIKGAPRAPLDEPSPPLPPPSQEAVLDRPQERCGLPDGGCAELPPR